MRLAHPPLTAANQLPSEVFLSPLSVFPRSNLDVIAPSFSSYHSHKAFHLSVHLLSFDRWEISLFKCYSPSCSGLGHTPLTATAAMPAAHMKIYRGEPVDNRIAENVKIGNGKGFTNRGTSLI